MIDAAEILELTQRLLNAIATGDWETYQQLCHPGLTCFEPEAVGQLVEGLEFHRFYFNLRDEAPPARPNTTMASPQVWPLGDEAAVVAYVRLVQRLTPEGPQTSSFQETRVWQRQGDRWLHIHFHRSA